MSLMTGRHAQQQQRDMPDLLIPVLPFALRLRPYNQRGPLRVHPCLEPERWGTRYHEAGGQSYSSRERHVGLVCG